MGLVKHGDGSIIPDNESQKTASSGMSKEAAEALQRENEEADRVEDSGSTD